MPEYAYVYILSNTFHKLYIGVTTNLERRIWEHKQKTHPTSHTAKYSIAHLVYFERFTSLPAAIKREKSSRVGYEYGSSISSSKPIPSGRT